MRAEANKPIRSRALRDASILRDVWNFAAVLVLLFLSIWAPAQADAQSAEIIVNPAVEGVPLDRSLLRSIFTMQLRAWPNGKPIRVFVLPDSDPLSDRFYREQLGIYSYMLRASWDRMVFTGTGLAPTVVKSESEMRERVRSTPGAIGFVSKEDATAIQPQLPDLRLTRLDERS